MKMKKYLKFIDEFEFHETLETNINKYAYGGRECSQITAEDGEINDLGEVIEERFNSSMVFEELENIKKEWKSVQRVHPFGIAPDDSDESDSDSDKEANNHLNDTPRDWYTQPLDKLRNCLRKCRNSMKNDVFFKTSQMGTGLKGINVISFSPSFELYATGSNDNDKLRVWKLNKSNHEWSDRDCDNILALAFSPNGEILAAGGSDQFLRLYNSSNGVQTCSPKYLTDAIAMICFNAKGSLIGVVCQKISGFTIFNVADNIIGDRLLINSSGRTAGSEIRNIAFGNMHDFLFAFNDSKYNGVVVLQDCLNASQETSIHHKHNSVVHQILFSHNDQFLATLSEDLLMIHEISSTIQSRKKKIKIADNLMANSDIYSNTQMKFSKKNNSLLLYYGQDLYIFKQIDENIELSFTKVNLVIHNITIKGFKSFEFYKDTLDILIAKDKNVLMCRQKAPDKYGAVWQVQMGHYNEVDKLFLNDTLKVTISCDKTTIRVHNYEDRTSKCINPELRISEMVMDSLNPFIYVFSYDSENNYLIKYNIFTLEPVKKYTLLLNDQALTDYISIAEFAQDQSSLICLTNVNNELLSISMNQISMNEIEKLQLTKIDLGLTTTVQCMIALSREEFIIGDDQSQIKLIEKKNDDLKKKNLKIPHKHGIKGLSMNGSLLASLDGDGNVALFDLSKKKFLYLLPVSNVNALVLTRNRIYLGGNYLRILDIESKLEICCIKNSDAIVRLAVSQDQKKLITAHESYIINVFKDLSIYQSETYIDPYISEYTRIKTTRDGSLLYALSLYCFTCFDIKQDPLKPIVLYKKNYVKERFSSMAEYKDFEISKDEMFLFLGGKAILKVSAANGEILNFFVLDSSIINTISLSGNGNFLICTVAGELKVFDTELKPVVNKTPDQASPINVNMVWIHPSENFLLAACDDSSLKIFETSSLKVLNIISNIHTQEINSIDVSFDGRLILTASQDNSLCVVKLRDIAKEFECKRHSLQKISWLKNFKAYFLPNNNILATCADWITLWKFKEFHDDLYGVPFLTIAKFSQINYSLEIALNKKLNRLIYSTGTTIKAIDLKSNVKIFQEIGHPNNIDFFEVFQNRLIIIESKSIFIYDIGTMLPRSLIELEHDIDRKYLFSASKNDTLAFITRDNAILLVDLEFGGTQKKIPIPFFKSKITSLLFLNSDNRFFICSEYEIAIITVDSNKGEAEINFLHTFKHKEILPISNSKIFEGSELILISHDQLTFLEIIENSIEVRKRKVILLDAEVDSIQMRKIQTHIIILDKNKKISIFDFETAKLIKSFLIKDYVQWDAFHLSSDAKYLYFKPSLMSSIKCLELDTFTTSDISNTDYELVQFLKTSEDANDLYLIALNSEYPYRFIHVYKKENLRVDNFIMIEKLMSKFSAGEENISLKPILNSELDTRFILGTKYPFNIFHYSIIFNNEKFLEAFLNQNIDDENSNTMYDLLYQKDFLGNTPFDYCIYTGFVNDLEILIRLHLKIKPEVKLDLQSEFDSHILDQIVDYFPSYVSAMFESQFVEWTGRGPIKLPLKDRHQTFVYPFSNVFVDSESLILTCNGAKKTGTKKKTDFNCKVLLISDILYPKNPLMLEFSQKMEPWDPLFQTDSFKALIEFKWRLYGKKFFYLSMLKYFIFFLLVLINFGFLFPRRLTEEEKYQVGAKGQWTWDWSSYNWIWDEDEIKPDLTETVYCEDCDNRAVPNISVALKKEFFLVPLQKFCLVFDFVLFTYFILFILSYEIRQLISEKMEYFKSSLWNRLDVLIIIVLPTAIVFDILEILLGLSGTSVTGLKILLAFTVLITWIRLADFWRGFKTTGFLVRLLEKVFIDIRAFFIVLFFLLFGFIMSSYLLQDNYQELSLFNFFEAYYVTLVGDLDEYKTIAGLKKEDKKELTFSGIYFFLLIIITIFFSIIMINLLIAFVNGAYERVMGVEDGAFQYEKLQLLNEYEGVMKPEQALLITESLKGKYLHSIKAKKNLDIAENPRSKINDYLENINDSVMEASENIHNLMDDIKMISDNQIKNQNFLDTLEQFKNSFSEELKKSILNSSSPPKKKSN